MMHKKYEKALMTACSDLDSLAHCDGKIISCANSIIELNQNGTKLLLGYLNKLSTIGDSTITKAVTETKDALIDFYGYKQLSNICQSNVSCEDESSFDGLMSQLNNLVGLDNVKSIVSDLISFHTIQVMRKEQGLHTPKRTLHLAFTGSPGTGKTTVARIVGRIYKKIGLLSKGHFIEVSRTDLIAGYQGQTAHKVKAVIERAKGGVLFIDEAYSITENDKSDSYGRECLTELTKALEDYRDDLVVIVAGYTEPMRQFFESNPGLKSRFNTFIEFKNYSKDELFSIFKSICDNEDYSLTEKASREIENSIAKELGTNKDSFSNGRFVRNLFDAVIMNHARRVSKIQSPSLTCLKELTELDVNSTL